ncbi:MAG: discoidin domain-containing protein [Akkermansiaceae bacterium]|nr:discoidin domain-containing protein [Akkermansiaceae bacterium]MCF7731739.1 discoidin domain-containing protein [Akkermansiaceae bacterium]
MTTAMLLALAPGSQAWEPGAKTRDAALKSGSFEAYLADLGQWVSAKVPSSAPEITAKSIGALLNKPQFLDAVIERRFLMRVAGNPTLAAWGIANPKNREFLSWVMSDAALMDAAMLAATPTAEFARVDDSWSIDSAAMENWKNIYHADPASRKGLYLRLAVACVLRPPGSANVGVGQAAEQSSVLDRYLYYRKAHAAGELMPSFDTLTIWEMTHVVSACVTNADLDWGREALNTWKPSFRQNEDVVAMVGQVWRRDPNGVPYKDMSCVMAAGGKCGPRSSFGVFINQAFGIPATGVGQPGHAAVTYRGVDGEWHMAQGRGFNVSKIFDRYKMTGDEFLTFVKLRNTPKFALNEHLRWLAATLEKPEESYMPPANRQYANPRATAVYALMNSMQPVVDGRKGTVGRGGSQKQAAAATVAAYDFKPEAPIKLAPGVIHVEAEKFYTQMNVGVENCYTGGKQVYFPALTDHAMCGYKVKIPQTGTYQFTARVATVNWGQQMYVRSFGAMYPVKEATASNVYRNQAFHAAKQAVDHDLTTRWAMDFGKEDGWLELDLGKPRKISKLIIDERALNYVCRHRIEYQVGGEWKTLMEGEYLKNYVKSFPPVMAQNVRLRTFEARAPTGGPTVRDFSVGDVLDGNGFIEIPWAPASEKDAKGGMSGRWQTTKPMEMNLVKGEQDIWVCTQTLEGQRSVALRWFELTPTKK